MRVVASYCTTFLKPEMLHIYRQVTGLRRYQTFVLTKERRHEERFPFPAIKMIPRARKNFLKRFYLKYVRKLPPVYYRGELQVLARILQRRRADLMHVYFGHTGVHLLPFIKAAEIPIVVSFHGADVMLRPEQPGYDEELHELLQVLPLVLVRSNSLALRLQALGCPAEKIRLNRTGIPLEDFPFTQRLMPGDTDWRFVQACRLIPKKGLITALRAFAIFLKKHPGACFTIAGDGPMKDELRAEIEALGIGDSVRLRGFLSQPDLYQLYKDSHVFVHPSELTSDANQEGIPNSMLEAMATGLPVLATEHGGIPEAVAHERTGFLVPERDVDALAAAMSRVAESMDYIGVMGKAASDSVREQFDQVRQIERLEACYDEVLTMKEQDTR